MRLDRTTRSNRGRNAAKLMNKSRRSRDGSDFPPADRNIRVIADLERRALHDRSSADRLSDAVTRVTGSGAFAAANLILFAAWILLNSVPLTGSEPFDPFPFNFLTLIVSLEAIFLAIFVLMSQNRMTRAAEKRAHLDLQVDLLAEQELTMMLRMLHALCGKLDVDVKVTDARLRHLLNETDVHKLAAALDDRLPEK
jgi:uncharacterized membrane protein